MSVITFLLPAAIPSVVSSSYKTTLVTRHFVEEDASENAASRLYVERGPISYHDDEAPLLMVINVEPLMLLLTVDA